MKDLLESILAHIPHYLNSLGAVLSGPKAFFANLDLESNNALQDSLIFCAISIALSAAATSLAVEADQDIYTIVAVLGLVGLLTLALTAFALKISWRIVGGRASFRSTFVIYSYIYAVAALVSSVFQIISVGAMRLLDNEAFKIFVEARKKGISIFNIPDHYPDLEISAGVILANAILLFGFVFVLFWIIATWGGFRYLNRLSRIKSFLAFMVFGLISIPLLAVTITMLNAFNLG